ncbi:MAG: phosphodiester glycosidase family protein [Candidatus Acetothermia bacterium]|jgi:hypothetical protein|nr:phosphodiester glycosidase family protein [Candidatus Acetothermia bacterium]MDH7505603.1 phosphodiester glycosidase family protein [Candidatus Acetothermia bacterium]
MSKDRLLRGLRALPVALALVAALGPAGLAQRVIVNGHEVRLEHRLLRSDGPLLAPVIELAPYLGAEAAEDGLGLILRWGLGREARLPAERLARPGGLAYLPLEELAELLGVAMLDFTDSVYLFPPRSRLVSLAYANGVLRLGFTSLAPFVLTSSGRRVELRFYNAALAIAPRTSRYSSGNLEALEVSSPQPDQPIVGLKLRAGAKPQVSSGFSGGGYWVELSFPSSQAQAGWPTLSLGPWIGYYRREWPTPAGGARVDYLLIKDYQAHYRLRVGLPRGGPGKGEPLEAIVQAQGGVAGINANFFNPDNGVPIGLIIKDGLVRSSPYGQRGALGVDLFGRVVFFQEGSPPPFIPLRDAVSAGPLLLREGRVVLDPRGEGFSEAFATARAVRSALGITPQGDLIMLVAGQGTGSAGLTLEELARLMEELGAVDALALDGGSSASLVFRQGKSLQAIGNRVIAVGLVLIPR